MTAIGNVPLFVPHARVPIGALPWPPKPNLALVFELAEFERLVEPANQAQRRLVEL